MDGRGRHLTQGGELTPARELAVWLRALTSFFDTANHPLSDDERAGLPRRSFNCETRAMHDALLRALSLIGSVERGETVHSTAGDSPAAGAARASHAGPEETLGLAGAKGSLAELSGALKDAYRLSEALLESPSVGYGGWSGLGNIIERELARSEAAALIVRAGHDADAAGLQEPLASLARGVEEGELGEDLLAIFAAFSRLLGLLRFVEASLARDGQLKRLLPVFTLINEETRALLDFIEGRALRVEGLEKKTRDILDGTAYAIGMELRKAFEHELIGFCSVRQPPQIFAKAENACGLLRDCFQQSVVALAQSFDASLDGERLFGSFRTKLEQSLELRRDLWRLVQLVRRAGAEADAVTQPQLLEGINAFHEGSIRFLMYKDWEPFERFAEEVETARGLSALSQTLHRFEAFLETLFGQVNMRAVLDGHPFDPNSEVRG